MRGWWKWLGGGLAAMLVAGAALLAYGFVEARSDPRVRRFDMAIVDWPAGTPPIRVALLSDIHIGSAAMDGARLARIVGQVNAQRPDLVVIAGDFVFGHDPVLGTRFAAQLGPAIRGLHARLGVIAVPGNHDHWTALPTIRRALEGAGITVLANQAARRGPLVVLGVDDEFSRHDDLAATLRAAVPLGGVPILLTHSPDLIKQLPADRAALMLAGHTHCGQVVLPLIGAPANFPRNGKRIFDSRFSCGIGSYGAHRVIVTAGLGTSVAPLRIGAPPDWWLVTLGPAR